jgi:DNA polymerase
MGRNFRVTRERGRLMESDKWAPWLMATVHPSSVLRVPDDDSRHAAHVAFV